MTMIDINCWERGCACYDSRIADETVEVVLAKQEQGEPVAWEYCEEVFWHTNQNLNDYIRANGTPLYTTPQQRTWVGLTDEEILSIGCMSDKTWMLLFAKAIEAKLKELNT